MQNDVPPYDARSIGNYFLERVRAQGRELSIVALMKLIYFAHGIHLARYGGALVKQQFEAWENGPVVRAVWESFRDSTECGVIGGNVWATRFDPRTGKRVYVEPAVAATTKALLDFVVSEYADRSPFDLVELTHEDGSPWHQVWNSQVLNFGMTIGDESIKQWFAEAPSSH